MLSNLKILVILGRRVQLSTSQIIARQPAALVRPAHSFLVAKYFQTSIDCRLSEKSFSMESQVHHDAKKNVFSLKTEGGNNDRNRMPSSHTIIPLKHEQGRTHTVYIIIKKTLHLHLSPRVLLEMCTA